MDRHRRSACGWKGLDMLKTTDKVQKLSKVQLLSRSHDVTHLLRPQNIEAMASNLVAMASNLLAIDTTTNSGTITPEKITAPLVCSKAPSLASTQAVAHQSLSQQRHGKPNVTSILMQLNTHFKPAQQSFKKECLIYSIFFQTLHVCFSACCRTVRAAAGSGMTPTNKPEKSVPAMQGQLSCLGVN